MDGVLADLVGTLEKISGKSVHDYTSNEFWNEAKQYQNLFRILDKKQDADELIDDLLFAFSDMNIEILTAIPLIASFPTAAQDKENWIKEHFNHGFKFKIGPYARDKYKHAKPGDILIDDSSINIDQWNEAGGIGILHTSAEKTLEELSKLGI